MKEKNLKIKWAETTAVNALQAQVDELLAVLARVLQQPSIKWAFTSDLSNISDFMESELTGETRQHPLDKSKTIDIYTTDTPENRKFLEEIEQELGVPVGLYDRIYEVAIRLRDH